MTVSSALSSAASLPVRTQAGELAPKPLRATAQDQENLVQLVSDVREAALNRAAVEHLAYTIASKGGIPNKTYLANLTALLESTTGPATLHVAATPSPESEDEVRDAEEQESRHLSELRKQAEDTRDRLRRALATLENLRAALRTDTAIARHCARFAGAWQATIAAMDDLLQPSLETRLAQQPKDIMDALTALCADLKFQITDLQEPRHIPGSVPLA